MPDDDVRLVRGAHVIGFGIAFVVICLGAWLLASMFAIEPAVEGQPETRPHHGP